MRLARRLLLIIHQMHYVARRKPTPSCYLGIDSAVTVAAIIENAPRDVEVSHAPFDIDAGGRAAPRTLHDFQQRLTTAKRFAHPLQLRPSRSAIEIDIGSKPSRIEVLADTITEITNCHKVYERYASHQRCRVDADVGELMPFGLDHLGLTA